MLFRSRDLGSELDERLAVDRRQVVLLIGGDGVRVPPRPGPRIAARHDLHCGESVALAHEYPAPVLLDAIETTYERLPELIAEATAAASRKAERTVLFARPNPTAPKASGEARVKHTVKMSDTNRNVLDRVTAEVGAPSRNFLITVAYEAYLPTIEKS